MEATWGQRQVNTKSLVFIFLLISVSILALYITTNTHALERHGAAVISAATNCFSSNPVVGRMYNPTTGRNADICFDGAQFHVHITQDNKPITTFTKDKMKSLDQVVRYLTNAGYELAGIVH